MIVNWPGTRADANRARPRTYFVHVPKTAGITLKTFLENNYALGESLFVDQKAVLDLPAGELNRFALWSGHYSSEVFRSLNPRPDVTVLVVRDPLTRVRSWAAHGRRSAHPEYHAYLQDRSDLDAVKGVHGSDAFQSYWLARALRDGAESQHVPDASELTDLLAEIDLIGLTEHLDRFMQLISFRMGWPPPPAGWHINRRPDEAATAEGHDVEELRRLLAVDYALYAQAEGRFWSAYAAMLSTINSTGAAVTVDAAQTTPIDVVQAWLRASHLARQTESHADAVTAIESSGDQPIAGEGWWWRETPAGGTYRWTGPVNDASLWLAPLAESRTYDLAVDLMGAADWPTWRALTLEVNGRPVPAVHDRFGPFPPGDVSLRLFARLSSDVVSAQRGRTEITFRVPESRPVPGRALVRESDNTFNRDERLVGVAVKNITIKEASW